MASFRLGTTKVRRYNLSSPQPLKQKLKSGYEPILGALSKGPMSGYDIHKMYSEALAFFWQEGFGQIYPALKTLEEAGLIERLPSPKADASARKRILYRHTETGRAAFQVWLSEPSSPRITKSEVLLKLFFAGNDLDAAIEQVSAHLDQGKKKLKRLLSIQEIVKEQAPLIDLLVLKQGIYTTDADVQWAEEALQSLQRAQLLTTRPKVGGTFVPGEARKRPLRTAQ